MSEKVEELQVKGEPVGGTRNNCRVTFEDGWRVMRGPDGTVRLDETLTVGTAERLKVMGDLVIANDSDRPTVMIEKGAILRVYGKIHHLQHGQVVFQAFPYAGAEYVEITCT